MKEKDPKRCTVPPSKLSQNKALVKCEECGAVYKARSGLRKHMKVHEKIMKTIDMKGEADKNDVSQKPVSENMIVDNNNTTNNIVLLSDDGSVIDQGKLQDVEIVFIDES